MSAAIELSSEQYQEMLSEMRAMKTQVASLAAAFQREHVRTAKAAQSKLLTLRDAAAHVGVDVKTLRKAIDDGRVGTVTIQKRRMIPIAELDALLHPTATKAHGRKRRASGPPRGYSVEAELAKLEELDRCRR